MILMRGMWRIVVEAVACARTQRLTSLLLALIAGGATLFVLLTAGRAASIQNELLSRLDQMGTRSITVFIGEGDLYVEASIVDLVASYDHVEAAIGFGKVRDVRASLIERGPVVSAREVYGEPAKEWASAIDSAARFSGASDIAVWTGDALPIVGIHQGKGSLTDDKGDEIWAEKRVDLPPQLAYLGDAVLIPIADSGDQNLRSLVVTVDEPQNVEGIEASLRALLSELPAEQVTVSTAQELLEARNVIDGGLGAANRNLVLGAFVASFVASGIIVWTLVLLRRRDFGRRRALGASRTMVVAIVEIQVGCVVFLGAICGAFAGVASAYATDMPIPPFDFCIAVPLGLWLGSLIVCTFPALWASRRDPLGELRVP